MLANQATNALVSGVDPKRLGAGHPNNVPYQPFRASDQAIIIAVGNDRQFAKLAAILDRTEWSADPDYATNAARVAARNRLVPMISEIIATRSAAEWLNQLEKAGIPAGPINTISQALADPQVVHRGARISAGCGRLGDVPMVGSPIRIDGERTDAPLPPPALGEHSDLLCEMLGDDEYRRLLDAGVIGT
jgi:formyl-CoA transferase